MFEKIDMSFQFLLFPFEQQDGTMHSWTLHENSLDEVPIPSNTPGLRSSFDV